MPDLDLSKCLTAPWKPIRHTVGYRVSVGLVAAAMVCLPVIYFGLIAGAVYLVYLHIKHDASWFDHMPGGRAAIFVIAAWLAPIVVGVTVILFMLKPLFAPPAKREPGIVLEQFEEPRLYAFVHTVCDIIGAPRPRTIEINTMVNAAAGFRRGWISLIVPGDLVLIIGTPLVAGMTVGQFSGILAHEFGHFAQGAGMRSSFLIHSIMNWFARAAYERDAWDEKLYELSHDGGHITVQLTAALARFVVWITRGILIALLWIARVLGAVMSRAMEFDADRYECRFAGSKDYETATARMYELNAGENTAESLAYDLWKNKKEVPDDVGGLIADAANNLDPETRDSLRHTLSIDNTKLFDTHPSSAARIKAARKLEEPGVFHCELPASILFSDFKAAAVKASYGHFKERLGPFVFDATFIKTADILAARQGERDREQKAARFFGFRPPTWRPVFLGASELKPPLDPRKTLAAIKAARAKLAALREHIEAHAEEYRRATEKGLQARKAKAAFDLGFNYLPRDMGLKYLSRIAADSDAQECRTRAASSAAVIDEAGELAAQRLQGLLQLLCVPGVEKPLPRAAELRTRAAQVVPCLAGLRDVHRAVLEVRELIADGSPLRYAFEAQSRQEAGKRHLLKLSGAIHAKLIEIRQTAGAFRYPFGHTAEIANVGEHLVPEPPAKSSHGDVISSAHTLLERYPAAYSRALGELVEIANAIEKAVIKDAAPATA